MDYTIKSGDTLSGIAQRNGMSMSSILSANKNITNPDKIQSGSTLKIPANNTLGTPTQTIQTTDAQRNVDQSTQQKYDTLLNNKAVATQNNASIMTDKTNGDGTGTTTTNNGSSTTTNGTTTKTPTQTPQDAIDTLYNSGVTDPQQIYNKILNSNSATVDLPAVNARVQELSQNGQNVANSSVGKINALYDSQILQVNTQFDQLKKDADSSQLAMMNKIQSDYALRRETANNLLKETLGAHEKLGYQTGGNRYTPLQQSGILTTDELNGITHLGQLDLEEKSALLDASTAKSKQDWDNLSNKLNALDKISAQRNNTLKELAASAQANTKAAQNSLVIQQKVNNGGFSNPSDYADALAPSLTSELKDMKPEDVTKYLQDKSDSTKIPLDILKSSILKANTKNELSDANLAKINAQTKKTSTVKAPAIKTTKAPKVSATKEKLNDVNAVMQDFTTQMKKNNWKGANPDAYNSYRDQLMSKYGITAVNELAKQMLAKGIVVDKTK